MYLVILNGEVIGTYKDTPTEVQEGAELVEWNETEPAYRVVGDVVYLPLDPRDAAKKLLSAKWRKLKEIDTWDNAIRLAGVALGQYQLRFDDLGQQKILTLVSTIKELVDAGLITGDTLVAFKDAAGDTHKTKASTIRNGLQTYFNACQAQDEAAGNLVALVKAATTVAEVESIIVG